MIILGLLFAIQPHALADGREASEGADSPLGAGAGSQEPDLRLSDESGRTRVAAAPIVWRPNVAGAPSGRVGGAVRGTSAFPTPLVLAPDHLALTLKSTPSLFWHLDGAAPENVTIVFTLVDEARDAPLIEARLQPPARAGVNRVRLSDYGVELKEGEMYIWSIALVPDMANRARDQVSLGRLKHVSLDQEVPREAREFASRGFWYDALESLSDQVDADPQDRDARALRRSLLSQAGLEVGND
jgi:hypothetical protein